MKQKQTYETYRQQETHSGGKGMLNRVGIQKVVRFISIYGLPRTIIKVAGRTRKSWLRCFFRATWLHRRKDVSVIGCGQFAFATMSYFVQQRFGNRFLECFDVDKSHAESCAKFWGYHSVEDAQSLIDNPQCKYIYVASNHSTHTDYAVRALKAGKKVHIEKPIAVTREQLEDLLTALYATNGTMYVGYNRPYSEAVQSIDRLIEGCDMPITMGCFIFGHKIEADHWYRLPQEGTRVCGNMGHWLDLSMHLFHIRGRLPKILRINIMQADPNEFDENLTVSYATDLGDLVTITMTSRGEPFEGIRETIDVQCGEVMADIEDFRKMTLQNGVSHKTYKYSPKDIGHQRSMMQLFSESNRDWTEVEYSTLLMLKIADMVRSGENTASYDIYQDHTALRAKVGRPT